MSNSERKYSLFQYFLWVIAGSEIPVLKECPTDYNKHAAVGGMILATTVFAFCAGGYAAFFFTKDCLSAIVFGLLWAFLILSIDRCLVVTLKKDPTKKNHFFIPFLGRFFLSLIIAFMVSIPLEIFLFKDNIEANKTEYLNAKIKDVIKEIDNVTGEEAKINIANELNKGLNGLNEKKSVLNKDVNSAKVNVRDLSNKKDNPETFAYQQAIKKRDRNSADYQFTISKLNNLDITTSERSNLIAERDRYMRLRDEAITQIKNEKKAWYEKYNPQYEQAKRELSRLEEELIDVNERVDDVRAQKTEAVKIVIEAQSEKDEKRKIIENEKSKTQDGFISQFQILEYAANKKNENGQYLDFELLMFLWLIRILFLMIELLPTIVKMVSPIGSYDWAIYYKEKQFSSAMSQNAQTYIDHQNELAQIKYESEQMLVRESLRLESELKIRLLNEAVEVQEDLAKKMIKRFHETETKKVVYK